jgi:hypothetical protein
MEITVHVVVQRYGSSNRCVHRGPEGKGMLDFFELDDNIHDVHDA